MTPGPLWSSKGKPMTRCRFLLDPTTGEACRHLEWWRKLSYHILTFQPLARIPSQTGNVYLNTAVSSMFQSQVKNQRCPLLPHSTVQATTSLWVRSGPPPALRQDRAKGSCVRAYFPVSSFSRPRLWLEKNYIRGLLLYSEGQMQHLFTLCSMLNVLFRHTIHFLSPRPLSLLSG